MFFQSMLEYSGASLPAYPNFWMSGSPSTNHYAKSIDGNTWTSASFPAVGPWAVYGKRGCFLAYNGSVLKSSPDFAVWSTQAMPGTGTWTGLRYNSSVFLMRVSGTSNRVATSPTGLIWTEGTFPSSDAWATPIWNGTYWLASCGGTTNKMATSTDGLTWAAITLPSSTTWGTPTWNGSQWVIFGSGTTNSAAYSADGAIWTGATLPSSTNWATPIWTGGAWVSLAGIASLTPMMVCYSTDGIIWYQTTLSWTGQTALYNIGAKLICATKISGHPYFELTSVSDDNGATWTTPTATLPASSPTAVYMAVVNNILMYINTSILVTSVDGINWIVHTTPATSSQVLTPVYINGIYFIVGTPSSNKMANSTDLDTWHEYTIPTTDNWFPVQLVRAT